MEDLLSGKDTIRVGSTRMDTSHMSFNYTAPSDNEYYISFERKVLPADVRKQKLDRMPGFSVSWHYIEVEPNARRVDNNEAFVRNYSNNIDINIPP